MKLNASGWVRPAGKYSVSAAWRFGSEANLMNSRHASAFGVPARIDQLSPPQIPWFHTISTGAPAACAACGRDTQVGSRSISPEISICSTCAPLVHHTATDDLILSSDANALSRLQGYTSAVGTPAPINASSIVSKGCLRTARRPGNSVTFQKSAQDCGALRPLKASAR